MFWQNGFSIPLTSVQTKLKRMATEIFLMDMMIYIIISKRCNSLDMHIKRDEKGIGFSGLPEQEKDTVEEVTEIIMAVDFSTGLQG